MVAKYEGDEIRLTNKKMGTLDLSTVNLHQVALDFGVETVYTLQFRPTNPIPRSGWVKVVYPASIKIAD